MSAPAAADPKQAAGKKKEVKEKKKGAEKFADVAKFVNTTPQGALKDFKQPMADAYYPAAVEAAWDSWWQGQDLYKPDKNSDAEKFVMVRRHSWQRNPFSLI